MTFRVTKWNIYDPIRPHLVVAVLRGEAAPQLVPEAGPDARVPREPGSGERCIFHVLTYYDSSHLCVLKYFVFFQSSTFIYQVGPSAFFANVITVGGESGQGLAFVDMRIISFKVKTTTTTVVSDLTPTAVCSTYNVE